MRTKILLALVCAAMLAVIIHQQLVIRSTTAQLTAATKQLQTLRSQLAASTLPAGGLGNAGYSGGLFISPVGFFLGVTAAAIVIPQFIEADHDARDSALRSDLQTLRSQLELYSVQHLDKYPSAIAGVGLNGEKFVAQLLFKTNSDGAMGGDFGPYAIKLPTNPFVPAAVGSKVKIGKTPCPGDGSTGWYFDISTNKFSANDPAHKNE